MLGTLVILAVGVVVGGYFGAQAYYGAELPSVEVLGAYRPPTVSVVYDEKGELMGEIYEKRRYVVDLAAMPPHLTQAFISAEDASYYEHGGIDYMGIVRAVGRNALAGKRAQGASTITQQVARNFLLTNEKTFARKIKEALLAWRIEETFDKEHILYLYLNQIYLGSGAYGVEAASRVYFDKHVGELTLAKPPCWPDSPSGLATTARTVTRKRPRRVKAMCSGRWWTMGTSRSPKPMRPTPRK